MEGKEFWWDGDIIREKDADMVKKTILATNRRDLEEKQLEMFQKYLGNL